MSKVKITEKKKKSDIINVWVWRWELKEIGKISKNADFSFKYTEIIDMYNVCSSDRLKKQRYTISTTKKPARYLSCYRPL